MPLARASRAQGNRRRSMEASDTLNLHRSSGAKSEEGCHKAVDVRAVRIQSKITRASFALEMSQRIRFSFCVRSGCNDYCWISKVWQGAREIAPAPGPASMW